MQIAAGAKGITCQKLGEAEVMVDGGIDDILISYNLLGRGRRSAGSGPAAEAGDRSPSPPTTPPSSPACRRPPRSPAGRSAS